MFLFFFVTPLIFVCTKRGACFFFVFARASLCGAVLVYFILFTGNGTDARRAADRTVLEVRHERRKYCVLLRRGWELRPDGNEVDRDVVSRERLTRSTHARRRRKFRCRFCMRSGSGLVV